MLAEKVSTRLKEGQENIFAKEVKAFYLDQLSAIKSSTITGFETSRQLSELIDEVIIFVFQQVCQAYKIKPDLAVIAVGSYGRNELNPYSDIDLLFLHSGDEDPETTDFITKILYILWDMKLTLGHSSRNIKNVINFSGQDITFKTTLIHHRLICGDNALYEKLDAAVLKLFSKNRFAFYQILVEKMAVEGQTIGHNVLLKEPNIKESLGGLRGIHLVRWLAFNFLNVKTITSLVDQNYIAFNYKEQVEDHLDYLLSLRNSLHFLAGRKEDTLTLEFQEILSQDTVLDSDILLESKSSIERIKIETFMREFYIRSKDIFRFVMNMIERFNSEANQYRQFARFINKRKVINNDFIIINDKLYFKKRSSEIVFSAKFAFSIFTHVAHYGCFLSQEVDDYIKSWLTGIDKAFRMDLDGFNQFKKLLSYERNLYHTLSIMHHVGFLSQYFPYFNELECTVQHDYYHAYTVDEHTLQGIRQVEELFHINDRNFFFLKNVLASLTMDQRFLLYWGILFHDIGKGRPGNHVTNGEPMINDIVNSFPFTPLEKKTISFLVNQHLVMIHVSQRSDFNDLKILYRFVNNINNLDRLNLMLLLSYADLSSVAPKVYTLWKGELLKELYKKTYSLLENKPDSKLLEIKESDFAAIKDKILNQISEDDKAFAQTFFNEMDIRFFIENDFAEINTAIQILKNAGDKPVLTFQKDLDHYKIKFYGKDRLGIFSRLTVTLGMNGINIHGANLFSKQGGYVVDSLITSSVFSGGEISETRWEWINSELETLLDTDIKEADKLYQEKQKTISPPKKKMFIPKTSISIDNEASELFTVIDIETHDQVGLLYIISRRFCLNNISLKSAFIYTRGNMAMDTFYVEGKDGGKIFEPQMLNQLKSSLINDLTNGTV